MPAASGISRYAIKKPGIALLIAVTVASLVGLLLLPPIPQDQSYHHFADQRTVLGIPNFWNVVSNIPFIAIGAVGCGNLVAVRQRSCSSSVF